MRTTLDIDDDVLAVTKELARRERKSTGCATRKACSHSRALLEVNVLIALLDEAHLHHRLARDWLSRNIRFGWASCPLTQNGCIRILSQASYPGSLAPAAVAEGLALAIATKWHEFWPDAVSPLDLGHIDWTDILGPRQVTDAYLLALAVGRSARLVTFDRAVPLAAVRGASAESCVSL